MKRLNALLSALLILSTSAQAQWYSKTYSLVSGWNAVWLSGDASHTTVAELVSGTSAITEVWRWNPNPDQTQFIQNPSTPTTLSDEWTVWKKDGTETALTRLVGNSAYLIHTTGATSLTVPLKAVPPAATWLLSGGNFIGFPALSGGQVISTYLKSMIAGGVTGLPSATKVYKYVGGDLSSTNPVLVTTTSERVDPDKPYWFNYSTVSDFEGPVHFELPSADGLAFGRTLSTLTVGINNRNISAGGLTFTLEASNAAPEGQPSVLGGVALTRRTYAADTGVVTETQLGEGSTFSIPISASSYSSLEFGVTRTGMLDAGVYASILRVKDSGGFMDVRIPVTAQAASPAGLWVCEVSVNAVGSTPSVAKATSLNAAPFTEPVTTNSAITQPTTQSFPLYFLIHVDGTGVSRILRQAFVGKLTSVGNALGITIKESLIQTAAVSDVRPLRYFSPIMPYASKLVTATGTAPVSLTWSLFHAYDDPANPFVHTYHPDHDNLDAKFANKLAAGVESYNVTRTCNLSFTATPPDNAKVVGWGSSIIGGNYTESISGINSTTLYASGTFKMRRLSEIGVINTTQ